MTFWVVCQGTRVDMPDLEFGTFEQAEIVSRALVKAERNQRYTINHDGHVLASVNSANDGAVWVNLMSGAETFV